MLLDNTNDGLPPLSWDQTATPSESVQGFVHDGGTIYMECETEMKICAAFAVIQVLYRMIVIKKKLWLKAKLLIYQPAIFTPDRNFLKHGTPARGQDQNLMSQEHFFSQPQRTSSTRLWTSTDSHPWTPWTLHNNVNSPLSDLTWYITQVFIAHILDIVNICTLLDDAIAIVLNTDLSHLDQSNTVYDYS